MNKLMIALLAGLVSLNAGAAGNAANGEQLAKKTCAACHAVNGDFNKPLMPDYPKLAGQHQDYLVHALTAYKRGDAPNGRSNPIMGAQVKALSDQEILDLAAYLHSLPSTLVSHR
ncbi:MAG: cytochrome c [Pseudomonadota bacterium]